MDVKPLSSNSKNKIDSYIKDFVSKYADGDGMFNECNAEGLGTVEDFDVLGWMYYEGIYASEEELVEATAYILGRALVRYAGFEWSEINIANNTILVLVHKEYDYIFTPFEYIIIKLRLLWRGNYCVEDLFFDAIFLSDDVVRNEEMHPLFALDYIEEYQSKLGFTLPNNIKPVLEKFWEQDCELLIRQLDVGFYEQFYAEDWKIVESKFKHIDLVFAKKYYKTKYGNLYMNAQKEV